MDNKKLMLSSAFVVLSLVLAGCSATVVISATPRPDEYFVNGLDIETQHLKLEGIQPGGTYMFLFPGITAGVDVWLGFNLAVGAEGHRDQATNAMVMTGLPANFEVMDAILTGNMDAAQYAAFATPTLVEQIRADPAYPNIQARIMEAWVDANENYAPEKIEQFRTQFEKEFGYFPAEITPAEIDRALPQAVSRLAAEGGFTGLKTLLEGVKDITPEGFTFTKGTWNVQEFANAMMVLDAVMNSGNAELIQDAQEITSRLLANPDGTFTVDTLNGVFRDLNALPLGEISPEFVVFGNLGIGLFWFGIMGPGEEAFGYYKQVVLPFPISVPGYATLPRITVQVATQIPMLDIELTDLQLDPLALPITLPILRAPLVALAASGKEMTFSTTVINIGFETGEYVLSEHNPAGWTGAGKQGIATGIRPLSYQISSYTTDVPARSSTSLETLRTHLDSIDIDEQERAGSGQAGDTSLNNYNEFLAGFPIFDSMSFIITKPLDLIVVEELNAEDGLSRGFAGYDVANGARVGTPAEGIETGSGAEGVVADPRNEGAATVNDALDGVAMQIRALRVGMVDLIQNGGTVGPSPALPGTGVNVWAAIDDAGLTAGSEEGAIAGVEDTRASINGPASPTASWTADALGSGMRLTFVSTAQELVDALAARAAAIDSASNVIALADAIPSAIVITTAAPGFGGSTAPFDTGSGVVPVPAELLVDALNYIGIGLIQDADGYATNPLLFSPGSGLVAGTGPTSVSGALGNLELAPAFALTDCSARTLLGFTVSPTCTNDATMDTGVTGVWKATGTETGAADTASGAVSGATYLAANDPTVAANQQYAADSALLTLLLNYGDLILGADAVATSAQTNAASTDVDGLVADAQDARGLAQGAAGAKAILVPAGHGAVTSFRLGSASTGFVMYEIHGRATLLAGDVQTSGWGPAFAESARDAGFGLAVSVNLGGVPLVFGSS